MQERIHPRRRLALRSRGRRYRLALLTLGLAGLLAALAAPAALADSTQSANWAGYAAHGHRATFTRVFGAWRQPSATCTAGTPTYSSVWVGLGGYNASSTALEQIGSEVDCSASGKVVSTAWYELVPAPSRAIRMRVDPGDELTASVSVSGHRVRLKLTDLTRGTAFTRTLHVNPIDVSSAEWILEAPSECTSSTSCQELPLANFGSAAFTRARAVTSTGHQGAIRDRRWTTTKITLAAGAQPFINGGGANSGVTASPTVLAAGGSAFTITYAASSSGQTSSNTRRARVAGQRLRPRTAVVSRPRRPA